MTEKGTIHIIDDEPIIHEVLGDLLTSEGYAVVNSSNGEEALEKHSPQAYELILLDLLMPGMDGIEVLKRLKKIDPHSVIIIITAYASVESAISAMKMGAFDYVLKPFEIPEMLNVIRQALDAGRFMRSPVDMNATPDQSAREAIIGRMVEFLAEMVADMRKEKLPDRMDPELYPTWVGGH